MRAVIATLLPFLICFATGCSSCKQSKPPFPLPAIIFHQPDSMLIPRLIDAKSFASFIQQIQLECDSYFSQVPPRGPCTLDVVIVVKPGGRSRFWLVYAPPKTKSAGDQTLIEKLERLTPPPVEEGPVSITMRLLLWDATEPDPNLPRNLILPQEWHDAIGTNDALLIPDEIMPKVWPDK
jgi:hypothetical protein